MQVSAINASVPSFKSTIKNQDDFNELVSSAAVLEDAFQKVTPKKQENDKKSVMGIAVSVGFGLLAMCAASQFAASRCIEIPVFKNLPDLMEKGLKAISKNTNKLSAALQGTDKKALAFAGAGISKFDEFAKSFYKSSIKGSGSASDAFVKLSGVAGAILGTKALVNADGNNDGVADIAQKSQNAYTSMLQNAEAINTLVKLIA